MVRPQACGSNLLADAVATNSVVMRAVLGATEPCLAYNQRRDSEHAKRENLCFGALGKGTESVCLLSRIHVKASDYSQTKGECFPSSTGFNTEVTQDSQGVTRTKNKKPPSSQKPFPQTGVEDVSQQAGSVRHSSRGSHTPLPRLALKSSQSGTNCANAAQRC